MHAHMHTLEIGCYNSDLLPREREFQKCAKKDSCNWEGDQEPRTKKPERDQESTMFKKPVVRKKEKENNKEEKSREEKRRRGAVLGCCDQLLLLWLPNFECTEENLCIE